MAEPVIRQVLALSPDDPEAARQLASCLIDRRCATDALEQAQRAVALRPDAPASMVTLGNAYVLNSQHSKAMECYRQALELKADYVPALFGLAESGSMQTKWVDVLQWCEKGLALKPGHCGLLRFKATALAATQRVEEALETMQEFLRIEPDSAQSHATSGRIMRQLARLDEAAEFLERSLAINPTRPQTHRVLGFVRLQQRQLDAAERHFHEARTLRPDLKPAEDGLKKVRIQRLLAQAKKDFEQKNYEHAEPLLRHIISIDVNHPTAQSKLAIALGSMSRYEEALELAGGAARVRPKNAYCRFIYGLCLGETEQHELALAEGFEAIRLSPDYGGYWVLPAVIHLDEEQFAEALADVERGLGLKSGATTLPLLRAECLAGLGREAEAIEAVAAMLSNDDQNYNAHSHAGAAYRLLKQYEKAEIHCRRAIELDKRGRAGHYGLGLTFFEQKRYADARPHLEEALRINPYARRPRKALAEIDAARASDNQRS